MKCPKCGKKLVNIEYGLPNLKMFEKVAKKELYLGGCNVFIGVEQPKYHCYNCNKNFYKDLINYEDTLDDDTEVEVPSFIIKKMNNNLK